MKGRLSILPLVLVAAQAMTAANEMPPTYQISRSGRDVPHEPTNRGITDFEKLRRAHEKRARKAAMRKGRK